ncbi:hypothetical protein SPSYN_02105 [Sporotomaculum syntrophicum]|uniref:Uncharacterized protein n=1 Tax=Sporotomaculum syntrophicum TaxID=182264 RepID=A0A9D3AY22_9FIRM|nr:hypothetical protein [Sporotomaculum syntrophicum]KAF1084329.1 hypothetical protein SPSYN_02105 [Sporotomaculum syntrophicum]
MKDLNTWAGRSTFSYAGSVKEGTKIMYGQSRSVYITAEHYENLLKQFSGKEVNIGTSRDNPARNSVGEWLMKTLPKQL